MGLTSIGDLTGDSVVLMVVADVCVCVWRGCGWKTVMSAWSSVGIG